MIKKKTSETIGVTLVSNKAMVGLKLFNPSSVFTRAGFLIHDRISLCNYLLTYHCYRYLSSLIIAHHCLSLFFIVYHSWSLLVMIIIQSYMIAVSLQLCSYLKTYTHAATRNKVHFAANLLIAIDYFPDGPTIHFPGFPIQPRLSTGGYPHTYIYIYIVIYAYGLRSRKRFFFESEVLDATLMMGWGGMGWGILTFVWTCWGSWCYADDGVGWGMLTFAWLDSLLQDVAMEIHPHVPKLGESHGFQTARDVKMTVRTAEHAWTCSKQKLRFA